MIIYSGLSCGSCSNLEVLTSRPNKTKWNNRIFYYVLNKKGIEMAVVSLVFSWPRVLMGKRQYEWRGIMVGRGEYVECNRRQTTRSNQKLLEWTSTQCKGWDFRSINGNMIDNIWGLGYKIYLCVGMILVLYDYVTFQKEILWWNVFVMNVE